MSNKNELYFQTLKEKDSRTSTILIHGQTRNNVTKSPHRSRGDGTRSSKLKLHRTRSNGSTSRTVASTSASKKTVHCCLKDLENEFHRVLSEPRLYDNGKPEEIQMRSQSVSGGKFESRRSVSPLWHGSMVKPSSPTDSISIRRIGVDTDKFIDDDCELVKSGSELSSFSNEDHKEDIASVGDCSDEISKSSVCASQAKSDKISDNESKGSLDHTSEYSSEKNADECSQESSVESEAKNADECSQESSVESEAANAEREDWDEEKSIKEKTLQKKINKKSIERKASNNPAKDIEETSTTEEEKKNCAHDKIQQKVQSKKRARRIKINAHKSKTDDSSFASFFETKPDNRLKLWLKNIGKKVSNCFKFLRRSKKEKFNRSKGRLT